MARKNKGIAVETTLSTKQAALETSAETSRETVEYLRAQISEQEQSAAIATKQAAAVAQAREILSKAGVTTL